MYVQPPLQLGRQLTVAAITDPHGLLVGLQRRLFAGAVVAEYLSTVAAVVAPHRHREPFGTTAAADHLRVIGPLALGQFPCLHLGK